MIYLLRHGETVWNTLGRFQGQKDSPLTPRGILQADRVAARLAQEIGANGIPFEFYVSPLGRAQETAARIMLTVPFPVREDARLMEVTTGCWDGMTLYEVDVEYPGALEGADTFDWYFRSPDGETFDSACARRQLALWNIHAGDRRFTRAHRAIDQGRLPRAVPP